MISPKEKYETDPNYCQLVDLIETFLHNAEFTPSEVREAAVMACIHYEMRYGLKHYVAPLKVNKAFETLKEWREKNEKKGK